MHGPVADERDPFSSDRDAFEDLTTADEAGNSPGAADLSLEELADQLERDPDECLRAFEGLETLEQETRLTIIEGLREVPQGPGVVNLLRLLAGSDDGATRESARMILDEVSGSAACATMATAEQLGALAAFDPRDEKRGTNELGVWTGGSRELVSLRQHDRPWPMRCLVTAVDGSGQGTIVLSSGLGNERRTAAFLCDLLRGIIDVVGRVEDESSVAGGLVDEVRARPDVDAIDGVPELARGLLAGCLMLSAPPVSSQVSHWLEATLGGGFQPHPFPAPGYQPVPDEGLDLLSRAGDVLEACPTWLDGSPLTFELAEEIFLREGRIAALPERDAGAFRFLFEHRIIHRLELYRRMLLWMAWFWTCGGEAELATSAQLLGSQLADEQYAVPSHPFATALSARSLEAAQRQLGTGADPRLSRRGR
jgi:hypothetical protein